MKVAPTKSLRVQRHITAEAKLHHIYNIAMSCFSSVILHMAGNSFKSLVLFIQEKQSYNVQMYHLYSILFGKSSLKETQMADIVDVQRNYFMN